MRFLRDIYLLIVLSVFIACSDEPVKADLYTMDIEIEAGFNESGARAEVDPANVAKVTWQAGDIIDVYMTDANGVIASGTLTTQSSGAYARFTGPVTASEGLTPPFSIRAVYGATVVAPQANRATFALGQFKPLMEAQCSEPIYYVNRISLSFSQVASAIHINNLPAQVSKVYLESLGENMVGVYSYNLLNGEGVANQNSVEVNAENGSAFIGVAPENYSGGFKLKLFDANGNVQYVKLPPLQVAKGHSYNIAPISEFVPINLALSTAEAYHIDASGSRSTGGATSDVAQSSISWGNVQFYGAPTSMIDELGVRIYDNSSNIVYSVSNVAVDSKVYAGASYNWGNYQKHGTQYVVKAFATIEGETYESDGTVVTYSRPTIYVNKPSESYTSYSKYLSGDVSGANNCAGSSIYLSGRSTFRGVTTEVFNQMSGTGALVLNGKQYSGTISGQGFSNSTTLNNQDWKAYDLKAMVSFDGMEYNSESQIMYVTGLPYNEVPTNSGSHPWKAGNSYATFPGGLQLGLSVGSWQTGKAYAYSCAFNIPANISVNLSVTYNKVTTLSSSSTLNVAQSDLSNNGTNYISVSNKTATNVTSTGSGVMTNQYNAFYFENSATVVGRQYTITKFTIQYR